MITLNKRFKTPVRKIFPRFIVCRRLRTQGRCRKLLRLCWPLHSYFSDLKLPWVAVAKKSNFGTFLSVANSLLRAPPK